MDQLSNYRSGERKIQPSLESKRHLSGLVEVSGDCFFFSTWRKFCSLQHTKPVVAEVSLPASKLAPSEYSGHPPFKSTTAAFVWCYMAVTCAYSSLARLPEVMSYQYINTSNQFGICLDRVPCSKPKAYPEIATVLQLQLTATPGRHLPGCTYTRGKMYVPHPITFKTPSQLAAIFYLYSDLAGEASKLAAVLSVALQFPQFWYSFPKRYI